MIAHRGKDGLTNRNQRLRQWIRARTLLDQGMLTGSSFHIGQNGEDLSIKRGSCRVEPTRTMTREPVHLAEMVDRQWWERHAKCESGFQGNEPVIGSLPALEQPMETAERPAYLVMFGVSAQTEAGNAARLGRLLMQPPRHRACDVDEPASIPADFIKPSVDRAAAPTRCVRKGRSTVCRADRRDACYPLRPHRIPREPAGIPPTHAVPDEVELALWIPGRQPPRQHARPPINPRGGMHPDDVNFIPSGTQDFRNSPEILCQGDRPEHDPLEAEDPVYQNQRNSQAREIQGASGKRSEPFARRIASDIDASA